MEHACSVCGNPDESGHAAGMCCEGCTCTATEGDGGWDAFSAAMRAASAVDNATAGGRYDAHPCGPVWPLKHSYVGGVCEDCGYVCDHEEARVAPAAGSPIERLWCPECDKELED